MLGPKLWIRQRERERVLFLNMVRVPELSTEHEQVSCVLLGALRHSLSPVPQLVEAVVDISNQLPAR